jgi:hypothetical protein
VFQSDISSIVIPVAVNCIQDNAFVYVIDKIYYEGTYQQWDKLDAVLTYNSIYYYSECVHESGRWTYIDGKIVDTISFSESVYSEPTCTTEGVTHIVCDYCGEVVNKTYTDIIAHEPDENGVCKMCGEKVDGKD